MSGTRGNGTSDQKAIHDTFDAICNQLNDPKSDIKKLYADLLEIIENHRSTLNNHNREELIAIVTRVNDTASKLKEKFSKLPSSSGEHQLIKDLNKEINQFNEQLAKLIELEADTSEPNTKKTTSDNKADTNQKPIKIKKPSIKIYKNYTNLINDIVNIEKKFIHYKNDLDERILQAKDEEKKILQYRLVRVIEFLNLVENNTAAQTFISKINEFLNDKTIDLTIHTKANKSGDTGIVQLLKKYKDQLNTVITSLDYTNYQSLPPDQYLFEISKNKNLTREEKEKRYRFIVEGTAYALLVNDLHYFQKVPIREVFHFEQCKELKEWIATFNNLSNTIIDSILSSNNLEETYCKYCFWLNCAVACYNLTPVNYNALFAISSALFSANINRLFNSAELIAISNDIHQKLIWLEQLSSEKKRFGNIRNDMDKNKNAIPYIGILQSDITFANDGNETEIQYLKNSELLNSNQNIMDDKQLAELKTEEKKKAKEQFHFIYIPVKQIRDYQLKTKPYAKNIPENLPNYLKLIDIFDASLKSYKQEKNSITEIKDDDEETANAILVAIFKKIYPFAKIDNIAFKLKDNKKLDKFIAIFTEKNTYDNQTILDLFNTAWNAISKSILSTPRQETKARIPEDVQKVLKKHIFPLKIKANFAKNYEQEELEKKEYALIVPNNYKSFINETILTNLKKIGIQINIIGTSENRPTDLPNESIIDLEKYVEDLFLNNAKVTHLKDITAKEIMDDPSYLKTIAILFQIQIDQNVPPKARFFEIAEEDDNNASVVFKKSNRAELAKLFLTEFANDSTIRDDIKKALISENFINKPNKGGTEDSKTKSKQTIASVIKSNKAHELIGSEKKLDTIILTICEVNSAKAKIIKTRIAEEEEKKRTAEKPLREKYLQETAAETASLPPPHQAEFQIKPEVVEQSKNSTKQEPNEQELTKKIELLDKFKFELGVINFWKTSIPLKSTPEEISDKLTSVLLLDDEMIQNEIIALLSELKQLDIFDSSYINHALSDPNKFYIEDLFLDLIPSEKRNEIEAKLKAQYPPKADDDFSKIIKQPSSVNLGNENPTIKKPSASVASETNHPLAKSYNSAPSTSMSRPHSEKIHPASAVTAIKKEIEDLKTKLKGEISTESRTQINEQIIEIESRLAEMIESNPRDITLYNELLRSLPTVILNPTQILKKSATELSEPHDATDLLSKSIKLSTTHRLANVTNKDKESMAHPLSENELLSDPHFEAPNTPQPHTDQTLPPAEGAIAIPDNVNVPAPAPASGSAPALAPNILVMPHTKLADVKQKLFEEIMEKLVSISINNNQKDKTKLDKIIQTINSYNDLKAIKSALQILRKNEREDIKLKINGINNNLELLSQNHPEEIIGNTNTIVLSPDELSLTAPNTGIISGNINNLLKHLDNIFLEVRRYKAAFNFDKNRNKPDNQITGQDRALESYQSYILNIKKGNIESVHLTRLYEMIQQIQNNMYVPDIINIQLQILQNDIILLKAKLNDNQNLVLIASESSNEEINKENEIDYYLKFIQGLLKIPLKNLDININELSDLNVNNINENKENIINLIQIVNDYINNNALESKLKHKLETVIQCVKNFVNVELVKENFIKVNLNDLSSKDIFELALKAKSLSDDKQYSKACELIIFLLKPKVFNFVVQIKKAIDINDPEILERNRESLIRDYLTDPKINPIRYIAALCYAAEILEKSALEINVSGNEDVAYIAHFVNSMLGMIGEIIDDLKIVLEEVKGKIKSGNTEQAKLTTAELTRKIKELDVIINDLIPRSYIKKIKNLNKEINDIKNGRIKPLPVPLVNKHLDTIAEIFVKHNLTDNGQLHNIKTLDDVIFKKSFHKLSITHLEDLIKNTKVGSEDKKILEQSVTSLKEELKQMLPTLYHQVMDRHDMTLSNLKRLQILEHIIVEPEWRNVIARDTNVFIHLKRNYQILLERFADELSNHPRLSEEEIKAEISRETSMPHRILIIERWVQIASKTNDRRLEGTILRSLKEMSHLEATFANLSQTTREKLRQIIIIPAPTATAAEQATKTLQKQSLEKTIKTPDYLARVCCIKEVDNKDNEKYLKEVLNPFLRKCNQEAEKNLNQREAKKNLFQAKKTANSSRFFKDSKRTRKDMAHALTKSNRQ